MDLFIFMLALIGLAACNQYTQSPVAESLPVTSTEVISTGAAIGMPDSLAASTPVAGEAPTASLMLSQTSSVTPSVTSTPLPPTATPTLTPTRTPPEIPIAGIQIFGLGVGNWVTLSQQAGGVWSREDKFHWDKIEPARLDPPVYYWHSVDEEGLEAARAAGINIIAVMQFAPYWAQKQPGYACGPIAETAFEDYARFMEAMVSRYSQPPYEISYWEIGNEPDIGIGLVDAHSGFGCWGDAEDPYYGGGYYAEMLKVVTPRIKAVDPDAQVLLGGLLLDCDLRNPPETSYGSGIIKDCSPALFLEGILSNGGGDFFDGISFHAYDYYYESAGNYGNPNWSSASNTTGPTMVQKVSYLRELLSAYGVKDKYLMNTENALLCGSSGNEAMCYSDDFELTKAAYLAQSFATAAALDLRNNIWFYMQGWRASGLVDSYIQPNAAYQAFKFYVSLLKQAVYQRDISEFGDVKGYEFTRYGGQRVWILWTLGTTPQTITLPSLPTAVYDLLGNSLPVNEGLQLTWSPVYIVW